MLRDTFTGVGVEVAVGLHLRHSAVQALANIGRGDNDRAARNIGNVLTAVALISTVRDQNGHHAALEVE